MANIGQQTMTDVTVIDEIFRQRGLGHRRLERDLVRPQIFLPARPPVRLFFQDVTEFRFGLGLVCCYDPIPPTHATDLCSPRAADLERL